jgi:type II secretory pathway pseudopilin PulG
LAEVLITLGIIGVVAALTLPSTIAKYQEKKKITQLKKAYSAYQQAFLLAVNEYGTPDNWDLNKTNLGITDSDGKTVLDNTGASKALMLVAEHLKKAKFITASGYNMYTLDGVSLSGSTSASAFKYYK